VIKLYVGKKFTAIKQNINKLQFRMYTRSCLVVAQCGYFLHSVARENALWPPMKLINTLLIELVLIVSNKASK